MHPNFLKLSGVLETTIETILIGIKVYKVQLRPNVQFKKKFKQKTRLMCVLKGNSDQEVAS
jgi:hypothetical protein